MPPPWHLVEQRRATAVVESACPAGIIAIMLVCPNPACSVAAGHIRQSPLVTSAPVRHRSFVRATDQQGCRDHQGGDAADHRATEGRKVQAGSTMILPAAQEI